MLEKASLQKNEVEVGHKVALKKANEIYLENQKDQIEATKQLKAHVLRLNDENHLLQKNLEEVSEKYQSTQDELEDFRVQLESKNKLIGEVFI